VRYLKPVITDLGLCKRPISTPINLEKILNEECKSKLSKLDVDFYSQAAKLIQELEEEKDKATSGSTKHKFVDEELRISKVLLNDIVDMRIRKIVTAVSISHPGCQDIPEMECMTPEERKLYDEVVRLIIKWKSKYCEFIYDDVRRL